MSTMRTYEVALYLACHRAGKKAEFKKIAPYILLPGAFRVFKLCENGEMNSHKLTHFEIDKSANVSGIAFPDVDQLKNLNAEIIEKLPKRVIGMNSKEYSKGKTSLYAFQYWNHSLSRDVYYGCLLHLLMDIAVSQENINTNAVYNNLCARVKKEIGEVIDSNWFEEKVFPLLKESYCEYMACKTIEFFDVEYSDESSGTCYDIEKLIQPIIDVLK